MDPNEGGTGPPGRPAEASWNPLRCDGTALPPTVLLAAKLLVLFLLAIGGYGFDVFLPFLPALDAVRELGALRPAYRGLFLLLAAALFLNRRVRLACFGLGALKLLALLACRTSWSNSHTFFACFLLLAGLQPRGRPPHLLRLQVALVYFGAGLNKLCLADWRGGVFFEHWTSAVLGLELYPALAAWFPERLLSTLVSWLTIGLELGLGPALLWKRSRRAALLGGLLFHAGMLVFTGGRISWIFGYAMASAYLVFLPALPGAKRPWLAPALAFAGAGLLLVMRAAFS